MFIQEKEKESNGWYYRQLKYVGGVDVLTHGALFSGIGAFDEAFINAGIEVKTKWCCEIDKYAYTSYKGIHGDIPNLGDISKVNIKDVPYVDFISYGFCCQDLSVAGNQQGITWKCKECGEIYNPLVHWKDRSNCPSCHSVDIEKTRSSMLIHALEIIESGKPKYAIAENVKNLVGKKFIGDFKNMLRILENMGYRNYYQVLNAKDYGIPQNRERVFVVSIREDLKQKFEFSKPFDNGLRLKDMLEDEVGEKYYLSEKILKGFMEHNENHREKETGFIFKPKEGNEYANCLRVNAALCPTDNTIKVYSVPLKFLDRNQKNYPSDYAMCVDTCGTNGIAEIKQVGRISSSQDGIVHDVNGISQCLSAGHGNTPKILQVGTLDIKGKEQTKRVYSTEGISPTLTTISYNYAGGAARAEDSGEYP